MPYADLHELLEKSSSSRRYFLTLPVEWQMQLHDQNACIHSAAQLHLQADRLEKHNRAIAISDSLESLWKKP